MIETRDAEAFADGAADPLTSHFAYHDLIEFTPDVARRLIEDRALGLYELDEMIVFTITDGNDDSFLGVVQLFHLKWYERNAEIGFWVAPWARGRNLALRAIGLVARWAFEEVELQRLEALVHPDNAAAQRVVGKAGFVREGILRGVQPTGAGRTDLVSYSLLPSDLAGG